MADLSNIPASQRMRNSMVGRMGIEPSTPAETVVPGGGYDVKKQDANARAIAEMRLAGASDDRILRVLSANDPGVKALVDAGVAPDRIFKTIVTTQTGQPYIDRTRTAGNLAELERSAQAREFRASEAARPKQNVVQRAGSDIAQTFREGTQAVEAGKQRAAAGGLGNFALGQGQQLAGVLTQAFSPLNAARAPIGRISAQQGFGDIAAIPFDVATMLVAPETAAKGAAPMARALSGAGRAAMSEETARKAGQAVARLLPKEPTQAVLEARALASPNIKTARPLGRALAENLERSSAQEAARAAQQAADMGRQARAARSAQMLAEGEAANVSPLGVGRVAHLTEQGTPAQEATKAAMRDIINKRDEVDNTLRGIVEEATKAAETAGKSVADLPSARTLLRESQEALSPNRAKAATISAPASPEQARVHRDIVRALQDRTVQLTEAEAKTARDLGYRVNSQTLEDGTKIYTRTFKTPAQALQDLSRKFGEAFSKNPEGFNAIQLNLMRDKRTQIEDILNQFVGKHRPEMQENWATASRALADYDTKLGKTLAGMQGKTDISGVTAAQAPSRIISGGAGGLAQFRDLAKNPQAALTFVQDAIETALHNPVTKGPLDYDEAVRKLAPGTPLGDILNEAPRLLGGEGTALKARVQAHLQQLNDAKIAGVRAKDFGEAAKTAEAGIKPAQAAAKSAQDLQIKFSGIARRIESMKPEDVVSNSQTIFKTMLDRGEITAEQHKAFDEMLRIAEQRQLRGDTLKKWIKRGIITIAGAGTAVAGVSSIGGAMQKMTREVQ